MRATHPATRSEAAETEEVMGYYGASMYRGDYYGQGDFYRGYSGDPGFFDFISDVGKGIVGVASKVLPYAAPIVGTAIGGPLGTALGGIAGGFLGKVLGPGTPIPSPAIPLGLPAPIWSATSPGTGSTAAMIPATPASFTGLSVGGPSGVRIGTSRTPMPGGAPARALTVPMLRRPHMPGAHHRRMNALNPRALSRALRRARGFQKYATKVLKLVGEKRHVDGFKRPRKGKR